MLLHQPSNQRAKISYSGEGRDDRRDINLDNANESRKCNFLLAQHLQLKNCNH